MTRLIFMVFCMLAGTCMILHAFWTPLLIVGSLLTIAVATLAITVPEKIFTRRMH